MAIYNGRILMRKGNEADFDASKLYAGEWAVSLDAGIVRICLEAGTVIRMATYESFEEDMKQIEAILLECQSIEEAVRRINTEVSEKLNACAEYVQQAKGYSEQAKQYRDEALQFRNEAEQFAPEGYVELKEQVQENTVKVDTIIAKADLGIKETASGEEIHLTDSAEGKAVEFALYGKAKQNTTSGKNLLPYPYTDTTKTTQGVTYTDNGNGSVQVKGINDVVSFARYRLTAHDGQYTLSAGSYIVSLGSIDVVSLHLNVELYDSGVYKKTYANLTKTNNKITFDITQDDLNSCVEPVIYVYIDVLKGVTVDTVVYPMIRLSSVVDDTWEPYTGGQPSPNPQYPQPIEVSGESYNLLENTATSQTINGVEFVVNEDKSISVKGTATNATYLKINSFVGEGKYILSGCPSSGAGNTYMLYVKTPDNVNHYDYGNGVSFETDGNECTVHIAIASGVTIEKSFYPMIRKASVKNDRYMPYGKGSVEVKSCGKNLFDKNAVTSDYYLTSDGNTVVGTSWNLSDYILVSPNTSYILSGGTNKGVNTSVCCYDKNKNYISGTPYQQKSTVMITTSSDTKYIRASIDDAVLDTFQIEKGKTETEYEPYKETLSTIPTENGLAGIKVSENGNYTDQNGQEWVCDEIVKYADGSGAYIQRVDSVDMGTLTWEYGSPYFKAKDLVGVVKEPFNNKSYNHALSTCFVIENYDVMTANNNGLTIVYSTSDAHGQVWCKANDYTDINSFKEMINGQYLYYELAEPIHTPLTAEELAEIEKLHTFYPVTNISNDFDCGMSVTYYADSKNYIDKKISELATAIVNNI